MESIINNTDFVKRIETASEYLTQQGISGCDILIILGSGFGHLIEQFNPTISIPYKDIPYFSQSTVEGHKGVMHFVELFDTRLLFMQGRFHGYEGYSPAEVTFPLRVAKTLGAQSLIVTNAAGLLNPQFKPGQLMLIQDHLNLTGKNPLLGQNMDQFGERFPDMTEVYFSSARQTILETLSPQTLPVEMSPEKEKLGEYLCEGIYVGVLGPSYETPAEIQMFRRLGGDAVGMSTVWEAITAKHMGMKILGISLLTNYAAGISNEPLSHSEVMETADKSAPHFMYLLQNVFEKQILKPKLN